MIKEKILKVPGPGDEAAHRTATLWDVPRDNFGLVQIDTQAATGIFFLFLVFLFFFLSFFLLTNCFHYQASSSNLHQSNFALDGRKTKEFYVLPRVLNTLNYLIRSDT